jgi:hypothetical protein
MFSRSKPRLSFSWFIDIALLTECGGRYSTEGYEHGTPDGCGKPLWAAGINLHKLSTSSSVVKMLSSPQVKQCVDDLRSGVLINSNSIV